MNDQQLDELARVFARMSGWLLSEETVQTALDLVTSLAIDAIDGAVGAGVTLIDENGRKQTTAATDDDVAFADNLQYDLDEGPCLTAWATREVVRVDDLTTDNRWPHWRIAIQHLGFRSILSAPMISQNKVLGAAKVYGHETNVFNEHSASLLTRFGKQAAILLANVQSLNRAEQLSDNLRAALQTRDTIALASGILVERFHISQEQALLRLMETSRTGSHELLDEANQIIRSAMPGSE